MTLDEMMMAPKLGAYDLLIQGATGMRTARSFVEDAPASRARERLSILVFGASPAFRRR